MYTALYPVVALQTPLSNPVLLLQILRQKFPNLVNSFSKKRRTSTRCYFYSLFNETSRIIIFIIHAKMVPSKSLVNESSTRLQRDTSEQDEECWISGRHVKFSAVIRYLHRRKAPKSTIAQRNKDVQSHLQVCTLQGHFYITTTLNFCIGWNIVNKLPTLSFPLFYQYLHCYYNMFWITVAFITMCVLLRQTKFGLNPWPG